MTRISAPCIGCGNLTCDRLQAVSKAYDSPKLQGVCDNCFSRHSSLEDYYAGDGQGITLKPKEPDVTATLQRRAEDLVGSKLWATGGHLVGSQALKLIGGYQWECNDIDLFFDNEQSYSAAHRLREKAVQWNGAITFTRVNHLPTYTRFDLTCVMCSISKDQYMIDLRCDDAIQSGECEVVLKNVVYPNLTAQRILKYETRGFKVTNRQQFAKLYPEAWKLALNVQAYGYD